MKNAVDTAKDRLLKGETDVINVFVADLSSGDAKQSAFDYLDTSLTGQYCGQFFLVLAASLAEISPFSITQSSRTQISEETP